MNNKKKAHSIICKENKLACREKKLSHMYVNPTQLSIVGEP